MSKIKYWIERIILFIKYIIPFFKEIKTKGAYKNKKYALKMNERNRIKLKKESKFDKQ